jgi:hypothetical protein
MAKYEISESYLKNQNLPNKNYLHRYTQHELDEFVKCMNDPVYFIKTYTTVIHVDKGVVPFDLYDYQEKIVRTVHANRFTICKMARQTGKSTTILAYLLHYILFNDHVNVAVLANKGDTARELLARLAMAFEYLPRFLQQGIITWNKGSIELTNGSRIKAAATSSSGLRGHSYNVILLDEFAHIEENIAEAFFASTFPTISSGKSTKVIMVSTPLGLNLFHKMWVGANLPVGDENKNEYVPEEVHWSQVPGRDEEWKRQMIINTNEIQFAQEHECEFLGSVHTLISGLKLRSLINTWKRPIALEEGGSLRIYEHPQRGHTYVITVDVSEGVGLDSHAFSMIDVSQVPYKQVAAYKNNTLDVLNYPALLAAYGRRYNDAFILVEINSVGQQVAYSLHYDLSYENLYKVAMKKGQGQFISGGHNKRTQFGLKTSIQTKNIGCMNVKTLIEKDKLLVCDEGTIREMTSFISHLRTYKAEEGKHDDMMMTLVLFGWLAAQKWFVESTPDNLRQLLQAEQLDIRDNSLLPPPVFATEENDDDWLNDKNTRDGVIWYEERILQNPFDDYRHIPKEWKN